jgi:hypothetical protein
MDRYSFEVWMLERHQAMARQAEARARLEGWQPRERLAVLVAAQLRQLADRLDGRFQQATSPARPNPG